MVELTILRRIFPGGNYSPPRVATGATCGEEAPTTSILQLAKAPRGKVFSTSFKIDVKRYMTKRQVETCEDPNPSTPPQET